MRMFFKNLNLREIPENFTKSIPLTADNFYLTEFDRCLLTPAAHSKQKIS